MKITMNVDCTPEEARTFLGLPDSVQDELMQEYATARWPASRRWIRPKWCAPGCGRRPGEQMQDVFAKMTGGKPGK
jgi:hypothetical protein